MQQASSVSLVRDAAPAFAALAIGALVLFGGFIFDDGDTFWHIATGAWILDHGRVPHADVFSWSRPNATWVAQEWLSEVLMATAWRAAGWTGVALLFAAAAGTSAWLAVRYLSRYLDGLALVLTSVLAFSCMIQSLLARPHLLSLPVLLIWTLGILEARRQNRAPPIALALLMIFWANMHGGFVLGFVVLGAFALEAITETGADRGKVVREWALFATTSVVAALITPFGFTGLIHPFEQLTMKTVSVVAEWRAADFSTPSRFEAALLVTLFVCLTHDVRVPLLRLLLLLGLTHMALQHERHQIILAALAPLILAEPLGTAFGKSQWRPRTGSATAGVFALGVLFLIGARAFIPVVRTDGPVYPAKAVASLPDDLKRQPVLNSYDLGGYLIFAGVRPYIDGRQDMYGDSFFKAFTDTESFSGPDVDKFLDRNGVAWTIFRPSDQIVATLDKDPHWRRLYADSFAVVHQRVGRGSAVNNQPTSHD